MEQGEEAGSVDSAGKGWHTAKCTVRSGGACSKHRLPHKIECNANQTRHKAKSNFKNLAGQTKHSWEVLAPSASQVAGVLPGLLTRTHPYCPCCCHLPPACLGQSGNHWVRRPKPWVRVLTHQGDCKIHICVPPPCLLWKGAGNLTGLGNRWEKTLWRQRGAKYTWRRQ